MLGLLHDPLRTTSADDESLPFIEDGGRPFEEKEPLEETHRDQTPSRRPRWYRKFSTTWEEKCSELASRNVWLRYPIIFLIIFIPSPVSRRLFPETASTFLPAPSKMHKTSWLDGLRGIACLGVVAYHFANGVYGNADVVYGTPSPLGGSSLLQLPGIRLMYAGLANVLIFFVISGYALSVKPVELMSKPNPDGSRAMSAFGSSVFRRFFRLYLPAWASTTLSCLFVISGFWTLFGIGDTRPYINIYRFRATMEKLASTTDSTGPTLVARGVSTPSVPSIMHLLTENLKMVSILDGSATRTALENAYNPPLWTIPVEYRASLILFLVQLAVFHLRPAFRISVTMVLMVYSIFADRFEMILFLGGFLIAQLDPYFTTWEQRILKAPSRRVVWNVFIIGCLIFGIYLASYPSYSPEESVMYSWLAKLVPSTFSRKEYFWVTPGALLIVFSIGRLELLCQFFSIPAIQYFGKISFAVYLIHSIFGLNVATLTLYRLSALFGNLERHKTFLFSSTFVFSLAIGYLFTIWFADLFWRFIDIPSVKFARWFETKLRPATDRA